MAHTLPDQSARLQALNPSQSFIVQAPAGSGKTALLIARILSLLATCQQPEQILAITFTRKAANEMRERIIHALQSAQAKAPDTPHDKHVWDLARKVCQQDQRLDWQLLNNPNRLRIQTIDAFCAQVTQQMPITSEIGGQPRMLNQVTPLYDQAADALLYEPDSEAPWHQALCTLLLHLDSNILTTKRLFVTMLGCRDQWLPYLIGHQDLEKLKHILERSLQHFIDAQVETAKHLLPDTWLEPLQTCLSYSQSMLHAYGDNANATTTTDSTNTLAYWQHIATLMLNKQYQWRKTVTKAQGFFAASHFSSKQDKDESKAMKSLMKSLLDEANDEIGLRDQLQLIATIPAAGYQHEEWQIIDALCQLLPILAAQLSMLFKHQGVADFTEISIKALQALSGYDHPSELSLALDRRIEHILIDEFQDTSITQYRLLETLTSGWQMDDGRTLFVVGDPMQSIYRFRQAEVGLFEQLKQHGIHHIKPAFLSLCTNFRSDPGVIDWINQQCQSFFPDKHQAELGAVPFTPAAAPGTDQTTTAITQCHLCSGTASSQAHTIVSLIEKEQLRCADSSIAILVRSRSHLQHIIPALKTAKIAYQAVDIQNLSEHPITMDLMSLTRAISHLADRTAWFAVLRAPWCGMCLDDMLLLAKDHETSTIWQQMNDSDNQSTLSKNGLMRLKRILPALNNAILQRGRNSLRDAVESTWQALGGAYAYHDTEPTTVAEAYLDHLEAHLDNNPNYSPTAHAQALQALYAPNPDVESNTVQIMTIHKAKGLEFDCVIIPDCQRSGANDAQQLMLWQQSINSQQHNLILAPLVQKNQQGSSCYTLLQYLEKCKQNHEIKRLLYVALTRAKAQIHCLAHCDESSDENPTKAPKHSLMYLLLPAFQQALQHHHPAPSAPADKQTTLSRLNDDWAHPTPTVQQTVSYQSGNRYQAESISLPSIVGTVIHHILWRLSKTPLETPSTTWLASQHPYWQQLLHHYQYPTEHHQDALLDIQQCITNTLRDPKGRWLLQAHTDAHSELKITSKTETGAEDHIIDRTFVDEDTRWIIDYKCVTCHTELKAFVTSQHEQHRAQLEHYAKIYHAMDASKTIKLGLYFPRQQAWHAWAWQPTTEHSNKQTHEA